MHGPEPQPDDIASPPTPEEPPARGIQQRVSDFIEWLFSDDSAGLFIVLGLVIGAFAGFALAASGGQPFLIAILIGVGVGAVLGVLGYYWRHIAAVLLAVGLLYWLYSMFRP